MTEANGTAPGTAPPAGEQEPAAEPGGVSERVLGWVGILFGAAVLAIGIDLATGGALSRAVGLGEVQDADSGSG